MTQIKMKGVLVMARIKIKADPVFQSWEDVDAALKEIAEKQLALMEIEGEMNKQMNGIKQSAALEAKPHQDRVDKLSKDVEAFVTEHRGELGGKTKVLNFGATGFRLSTKVIIPAAKEKLVDIIRSLRARKMEDCIIVKESVDKEALKKYGEDAVLKVGAKFKKEDTFWCEPNLEKLQSMQ